MSRGSRERQADDREHRRRWLWGLSVLTSGALLVANDTVLKSAYPGLVTGKLSDVAGLYLFGALFAWLFPEQRTGVAIGLALGFALWKSPWSGPILSIWNGHASILLARTVDTTDLVALPAIPLGILAGVQSAPNRKPIFQKVGVVLLCCVAFLATSRRFVIDLPKLGGAQTVFFRGSVEDVEKRLDACGIKMSLYERKGSTETYLSMDDSMTATDPVQLRSVRRVYEGRVAFIVLQAFTRLPPSDEARIVDQAVASLRACSAGEE